MLCRLISAPPLNAEIRWRFDNFYPKASPLDTRELVQPMPMPPRPFVNDALWRCLCPGFSPKAPSLAPLRKRAVSAPRSHPPQRSSPSQLRCYNQSSASSPYGDSFVSQSNAPSFEAQIPSKPRSLQSHGDKPPLSQLPTHILYEHLRNEGAKGEFDEVFKICRVLVKDRGESPNNQMYNGILHSFVSSANGTAGKVRKVLDEMGFWQETFSGTDGRTKIELDARGCECVLEVLAVHPDYLLRVEILEYMKSRWFPLSDRGHNYVVAGMLRERHLEQALELLEEMVRKKMRIEDWLFDKALWMLLEFGEVEEAFYVLNLKGGTQGRHNGTGSVKLSSALWGALLDAAAKKQLVGLYCQLQRFFN
jgi:pentatricopeptide repeat protein